MFVFSSSFSSTFVSLYISSLFVRLFAWWCLVSSLLFLFSTVCLYTLSFLYISPPSMSLYFNYNITVLLSLFVLVSFFSVFSSISCSNFEAKIVFKTKAKWNGTNVQEFSVFLTHLKMSTKKTLVLQWSLDHYKFIR